MANSITRSTVNSEQYAAPEHQKSGFDLSYTRHSSMSIGRFHVGGYQWCMPGDKISGGSMFNGTFKRLITPMVTPMRIMSYNIFLPFRAVDTSWMRGMTPTKFNSMSASWSVPAVSTSELIINLINWHNYASGSGDGYENKVLSDFIQYCLSMLHGEPDATLQDFENEDWFPGTLYEGLYGDLSDWHGVIGGIYYSMTTSDQYLHDTTIPSMAYIGRTMYNDDALLDVVKYMQAKLGTAENPISMSMPLAEFLYNLLDCLFTPFFGRASYFGELGYNYVRPSDIYRIIYQQDSLGEGGYNNFINLWDTTKLSEYPIRIMYAIWYELFRNVDLEPAVSTLPDWREFGSTNIDKNVFTLMCLWRARPWEKDMFTSAQIDDISRHVYAPIVSLTNTDVVGYHVDDFNNHDAQYNGSYSQSDGSLRTPCLYTFGYYDNNTGEVAHVQVPVPSNINDVVSSVDIDFPDVYGLDLNSLRQSQMLERYLKRNYLFGDEYQDRLLAHYNSRLSDLRINRPEIVGRSINDYEMSQEISNVSTGYSNVGDRTAVGEIKVQGDDYTTYCEEFGMLITLYTIMPRPQYDGLCPQLLLSKTMDFPYPEFASNNEEFGRKMEIAASAIDQTLVEDAADARFIFGRYPAYHAWRSRVDEVGGLFLNEMQDCTFRRFFGLYSSETTPKLNYYFLHCRPNLNMFVDNLVYDYQVYGDFIHECFVERVLPTPVEVI